MANILLLTEYAEEVNSRLAELDLGESTLRAAATEALQAGGKRVRAILALLWCEAVSGDYRQALPVAVAYELAHASALVQDDIIDNSDLRRGGVSIVRKYGLQTAILAANLLLFNVPKKFSEYSRLGSKGITTLFEMLGESCRAATTGEFLDLELARRPKASEADYERMVRLKTASMLGAPCAAGALVGGGTDAEVSLAFRFGEEVGMAYQMQDDLLDLMGDAETLGKPVFTDMRGGKKNVVLMHALSNCSESDRTFLTGLPAREKYTAADVARARQIFVKCGSTEYAMGKVSARLASARTILSRFNENKATKALFELSDYLAKRYY